MSARANARPRVIIESPFAGEVDRNVAYAQAALWESTALRGEAPLASHLLYTQILDDENPESRTAGIAAGLAWVPVADVVAFYVDLGWSPGMKKAAAELEAVGRPYEVRQLSAYDRPTAGFPGPFPIRGTSPRRDAVVEYLRALDLPAFQDLMREVVGASR